MCVTSELSRKDCEFLLLNVKTRERTCRCRIIIPSQRFCVQLPSARWRQASSREGDMEAQSGLPVLLSDLRAVLCFLAEGEGPQWPGVSNCSAFVSLSLIGHFINP